MGKILCPVAATQEQQKQPFTWPEQGNKQDSLADKLCERPFKIPFL
jgi:hypothetical protein